MNLPNYKLLTTNYYQRGFTLVEMVVVTAIIGLILTVILGSQSRYSDRLNLTNQAYNLAIKIREAQIKSLGVMSNTTSPQDFNTSYGISFLTTSANLFIFFIDKNFDGKYDAPGELLETVAFGNGINVSSFCGTNGSGGEDCTTPQLRTISVTFRRPSPVAVVQYRNAGSNGGQIINTLFAPARIELQSASGAIKKSIKIDSTGQISIQ